MPGYEYDLAAADLERQITQSLAAVWISFVDVIEKDHSCLGYRNQEGDRGWGIEDWQSVG